MVLTLSAVSPVTVTVQNWSSANFVLPSPQTPPIHDRSRSKIDTDPSHRCHDQSCFLQHLYFFLHLPKQHATLIQKFQITLHPSKISVFFWKSCPMLWTCLWHSFFCHLCPCWCLENQNPVGECCGNTSDTFDPKPNKTTNAQEKVEQESLDIDIFDGLWII